MFPAPDQGPDTGADSSCSRDGWEKHVGTVHEIFDERTVHYAQVIKRHSLVLEPRRAVLLLRREWTLALNGEVRTAMFGADYAKDRLVAGLSLARSQSLGGYQAETAERSSPR